jgi:hypothetical protein
MREIPKMSREAEAERLRHRVTVMNASPVRLQARKLSGGTDDKSAASREILNARRMNEKSNGAKVAQHPNCL